MGIEIKKIIHPESVSLAKAGEVVASLSTG
jgi:hypothetical protein